MMSYGKFAAHVNASLELFDSLDLLTEIARPTYSAYGAAFFRGRSYVDVWRICFQDRIFDAQLTDDSLIQFRFDHTVTSNLSYAYYDCPFKKQISFEEFVRQSLELQPGADEYELLSDYELLTIEQKDTVTPVRYDYSPNLYAQGRHPAAHMHFGNENNIRIATRKCLRPLSFSLFIIRQFYPDKWVQFLKMPEAELKCRNVSTGLDNIDPQYFQPHDFWEMHLV